MLSNLAKTALAAGGLLHLRHGLRGRVADIARDHLAAETSDPRNNALIPLACSFEQIVR